MLLAVVPLLEVVVDVVVLPMQGGGDGGAGGQVWEELTGEPCNGTSGGPNSSAVALLTSKRVLVIHLQRKKVLMIFRLLMINMVLTNVWQKENIHGNLIQFKIENSILCVLSIYTILLK